MEDSRGSHHPFNSQPPGPHSGSDRYSGHPSSKSSPSQQQQHYQQQQHSHASYSKEGRSQQQHQSYSSQDPDAGAAWRSPITPTTTRKFNRMAIHEVLDGNQSQHPHPYGHEEDSPPYKRRGGSPEEFSFSDPPGSSSGPSSHQQQQQHRHYGRGESRHYSDRHRPPSPRYRQESPMPGSNSEDEDDDIRNYKKRRMVPGLAPHQKGGSRQHSPPSTTPGAQPEVMDQVRSTLKLKQQQKAIIESRQNAQHGGSMPQQQQQQQQQPSPQQQPTNTKPSSSNGNNQPVTETTSSGLSVFHGSASFASLNRRAQPSPKNPKNAKSLTIFAPSYSESSLSIHSAPLQPSQSHQAMSMGLRTSQPLLPRHQHHPYAPHTGSYHQPLQSPRTAGHAKKSSRVTLRQTGQSASENSSGTLPAPILSSHTGPLPSPMYPSTPFLSNPKHMFMETVSSLFDSMDSTRSLKYTLEEQVRKSAQLLQTLQASGTMIENLVRGQFKELEKGVIERFEGEIEHLNARVRQLEEHQGLIPPPKKTKPVVAASSSTTTPPTSSSSSSTAMTGVSASLNGTSMSSANSGTASTSGPGEASNQMDASPTTGSHSDTSPNNGTLPTPPLTKSQDAGSAMEIEDGHVREPTEYNATVKSLQERVADLEKRKD
ncbi:hypothetical protein BGZ50_002850 [Haplosporangium sp. Z 11]|nr:hypothetical protein BGZ50_002850 [Haplosporangium sp. Z 11]